MTVALESGEQVAIAFGSNLGDREASLRFGFAELSARGAVAWSRWSRFYETEPVGMPDGSPAFLNAVAIGETFLPPETLLEVCQGVEADAGRVRTKHWDSRTLDLDILLYGDREIMGATLTIPHREMFRRAFVLAPLAEIAGDWQIGRRGTVEALRNAVKDEDKPAFAGLQLRWDSFDTR